ncbi:diguanylate cyclase [Petrotoga sp. 9T1HF07.CasAA.8.2]|uniref:dihydroorotate dehydrogenase electron transfer subunit n=1 Tax=Petrotoga sp. 9T1HF07.CasAA.8.2 TaxID=1434329 RepID=UPI000CBB265A|nr:dihydroorotate dehydrogenase electron transfer subunit [Petrotoga sp. 9T1HF07.CasAA.8.2]PNR88970.1 diguanylate cyclase [Petrotoga sp. 9T1HF07.CasAA.8.2]
MKEGYREVDISSNTEIAKGIFELKVQIESNDSLGDPGQFYMLRSWDFDPLLSRPFSICNIEGSVVTFLYKIVGRGTNYLSKLKPKDKLKVLGPLGNGFNLNVNGKVALISGGIGIPPMIYLAKKLSTEIDFYAGFTNEVYYMDYVQKYVNKIYITTEDGSTGQKGFITDIFRPEKYDVVFTCGPSAMMKKVVEKCENMIPVFVSMESIMACGMGACLGCSIKTKSGMKRVCKEGPVFEGREVFFDD